MKLPYVALGYLVGWYSKKFSWHTAYWILILAAFLAGKYFPYVTFTFTK